MLMKFAVAVLGMALASEPVVAQQNNADRYTVGATLLFYATKCGELPRAEIEILERLRVAKTVALDDPDFMMVFEPLARNAMTNLPTWCQKTERKFGMAVGAQPPPPPGSKPPSQRTAAIQMAMLLAVYDRFCATIPLVYLDQIPKLQKKYGFTPKDPEMVAGANKEAEIYRKDPKKWCDYTDMRIKGWEGRLD